MINIQSEVQKIHNHYGISEMANYKIQLLFEEYINQFKQPGKVMPSDEDIKNAACDYVDEEINHFAREAKRNAYITGATDMRDENIYISPKSLITKTK